MERCGKLGSDRIMKATRIVVYSYLNHPILHDKYLKGKNILVGSMLAYSVETSSETITTKRTEVSQIRCYGE